MENQNNQQPVPQQPVQQQSPSYPQSQAVAQPQDPQNQVQNPQVAQQQSTIPPAPPPPPKKRGFLKIVLIIIGIFIAIGLVLVIFRVVTSGVGRTIDSNKPVELTWWGMWENASVIDPIIAQYQEQNPNVTISYIRQSPEDYRERLANSLARGNGPDIFRIHNTWIPMFREELSPMPAEVMSAEEYENTFYRVALESALTDDGILAMPLEFDGLGLFINKEIFTTFALPVPDTWEEVRTTAEALTIRNSSTGNITQAGIALGQISNVDYWQDIMGLLLIQNRASLTEPSDTRAISSILFYKSFSDVQQRDSVQVWDTSQADSITAFASGKVGMIIAPSDAAYQISETNPGIDFEVVSVPQLPKSSESELDVTYASFWMEGVSARNDKELQAWKFLRYLVESENLQKLHTNATNTRGVYPEIYPRQDMRNLLLNDDLVGGIVQNAPGARFWYLAANTNDGETGLNTQLANIFESKFKDINSSAPIRDTAAFGLSVRTLLSQYGLAAPPPPPEE